MKKKILIIIACIVATIGISIGVAKIHYQKVYSNYIKVADCVLELRDNNLLQLTWYDVEEIREICADSSVVEIMDKNPQYFTFIYIMSDDEIAFRKPGIFDFGESGIAITRNDAEPVRFGGQNCPKDVIYKKVRKRVYRYSTGIILF